ncbi:tripartite-type tricarboxylate transporter receptor subunit TctC [Bradyrhizobium sp. AZCC 2262]
MHRINSVASKRKISSRIEWRTIATLAVGAFIALAISAGLASAVHAQSYPSRLVRFVVPFPAGGGVDLVIRAAAQELSSKWGTPVIVENRVGAGGTVGTEAVFRAAPDGYTLLATVNQTITTAPYLFKSLQYDPSKFTPITLMVQSDNFVLAHPAVPANSLRELVDLVKKQPKKWNYGSFGRGSQPQLLFEYLNSKERLDLQHIPYNGISPLLIAMITGEVSFTTGSAGVAGEFLRAGKLRALAIAGKKRSPQFPDVPTTEEAGFGYLQSSIWYAVFAPPGTSDEIVQKVGSDLRAILKQPDFVEHQITSKGLEVIASTPQELADVVQQENASFKTMIEAAGIQPE